MKSNLEKALWFGSHKDKQKTRVKQHQNKKQRMYRRGHFLRALSTKDKYFQLGEKELREPYIQNINDLLFPSNLISEEGFLEGGDGYWWTNTKKEQGKNNPLEVELTSSELLDNNILRYGDKIIIEIGSDHSEQKDLKLHRLALCNRAMRSLQFRTIPQNINGEESYTKDEVFVIYPKSLDTQMSKMEKIKRKKDKHETALIRSTVEYVEIECKKNVDNIYAKKLGQPIHYGDDIELLHLESGLFLTLTKDRYGGINTNHSSFYSKTAYETHLQAFKNEYSVFKIEETATKHSEGNEKNIDINSLIYLTFCTPDATKLINATKLNNNLNTNMVFYEKSDGVVQFKLTKVMRYKKECVHMEDLKASNCFWITSPTGTSYIGLNELDKTNSKEEEIIMHPHIKMKTCFAHSLSGLFSFQILKNHCLAIKHLLSGKYLTIDVDASTDKGNNEIQKLKFSNTITKDSYFRITQNEKSKLYEIFNVRFVGEVIEEGETTTQPKPFYTKIILHPFQYLGTEIQELDSTESEEDVIKSFKLNFIKEKDLVDIKYIYSLKLLMEALFESKDGYFPEVALSGVTLRDFKLFMNNELLNHRRSEYYWGEVVKERQEIIKQIGAFQLLTDILIQVAKTDTLLEERKQEIITSLENLLYTFIQNNQIFLAESFDFLKTYLSENRNITTLTKYIKLTKMTFEQPKHYDNKIIELTKEFIDPNHANNYRLRNNNNGDIELKSPTKKRNESMEEKLENGMNQIELLSILCEGAEEELEILEGTQNNIQKESINEEDEEPLDLQDPIEEEKGEIEEPEQSIDPEQTDPDMLLKRIRRSFKDSPTDYNKPGGIGQMLMAMQLIESINELRTIAKKLYPFEDIVHYLQSPVKQNENIRISLIKLLRSLYIVKSKSSPPFGHVRVHIHEQLFANMHINETEQLQINQIQLLFALFADFFDKIKKEGDFKIKESTEIFLLIKKLFEEKILISPNIIIYEKNIHNCMKYLYKALHYTSKYQQNVVDYEDYINLIPYMEDLSRQLTTEELIYPHYRSANCLLYKMLNICNSQVEFNDIKLCQEHLLDIFDIILTIRCNFITTNIQYKIQVDESYIRDTQLIRNMIIQGSLNNAEQLPFFEIVEKIAGALPDKNKTLKYLSTDEVEKTDESTKQFGWKDDNGRIPFLYMDMEGIFSQIRKETCNDLNRENPLNKDLKFHEETKDFIMYINEIMVSALSKQKVLMKKSFHAISRYNSQNAEIVRNLGKFTLINTQEELDKYIEVRQKCRQLKDQFIKFNIYTKSVKTGKDKVKKFNKIIEILKEFSETLKQDRYKNLKDRSINVRQLFESMGLSTHILNFLFKNKQVFVQRKKALHETSKSRTILPIFDACFKFLRGYIKGDEELKIIFWKYKEYFLYPELEGIKDGEEFSLVAEILDKNPKMESSVNLQRLLRNLAVRTPKDHNMENIENIMKIYGILMKQESSHYIRNRIFNALTKMGRFKFPPNIDDILDAQLQPYILKLLEPNSMKSDNTSELTDADNGLKDIFKRDNLMRILEDIRARLDQFKTEEKIVKTYKLKEYMKNYSLYLVAIYEALYGKEFTKNEILKYEDKYRENKKEEIKSETEEYYVGSESIEIEAIDTRKRGHKQAKRKLITKETYEYLTEILGYKQPLKEARKSIEGITAHKAFTKGLFGTKEIIHVPEIGQFSATVSKAFTKALFENKKIIQRINDERKSLALSIKSHLMLKEIGDIRAKKDSFEISFIRISRFYHKPKLKLSQYDKKFGLFTLIALLENEAKSFYKIMEKEERQGKKARNKETHMNKGIQEYKSLMEAESSLIDKIQRLLIKEGAMSYISHMISNEKRKISDSESVLPICLKLASAIMNRKDNYAQKIFYEYFNSRNQMAEQVFAAIWSRLTRLILIEEVQISSTELLKLAKHPYMFNFPANKCILEFLNSFITAAPNYIKKYIIHQQAGITGYNIIRKVVVLLGKCVKLVKKRLESKRGIEESKLEEQLRLIYLCLDCIDEFVQDYTSTELSDVILSCSFLQISEKILSLRYEDFSGNEYKNEKWVLSANNTFQIYRIQYACANCLSLILEGKCIDKNKSKTFISEFSQILSAKTMEYQFLKAFESLRKREFEYEFNMLFSVGYENISDFQRDVTPPYDKYLPPETGFELFEILVQMAYTQKEYPDLLPPEYLELLQHIDGSGENKSKEDYKEIEGIYGNERDKNKEKLKYLFQMYYKQHLRAIEVTQRDGNIIHTHFVSMPYGEFFNEELLTYMDLNVDRTNPETKVESIVQMGRRMENEMRAADKLYQWFEFPFLKTIYHQQNLLRFNTACVACFINILILISMGDSEDQVIWSRGAQTTITTVGILLTTMLGLMWIMHVPRRYYFHYLEIQGQYYDETFINEKFQSLSVHKLFIWEKLKTFKESNKNILHKLKMIKAIFFDVELLVYSLFFLFSFFATITGENSIYAMLLIMTYYISTAMQYIVTALWKVAGNLLGALVLVLLVLYIMIMILYTFFKGHVGAHGCDTFYRCYLIGVDQSFKDGMGMFMGQSYEDEPYGDINESRIFYDTMFTLVIMVFMMEIFAGIIIDKFGELRDEDLIRQQDKKGVCIICGKTRDSIEQTETFYAHTNTINGVHNVVNYFQYMAYLTDMPTDQMTGLEREIYAKLLIGDKSWMPLYSTENQKQTVEE